MKLLHTVFAAVVVLFACILFFSGKTSASSLSRPTITVINAVRGPELGLEKADLLASLQSQWQVTKDASVPATWLWQYSAMEDEKLVNFAKSNMQSNCHAEFISASSKILKQVQDDGVCDQEFGIFLEIDRNLAQKSDVIYRGHGPWYFSDGLLLISYDAGERKKIIDTVFSQFKKTFGYYPKSVGGWWVGAQSLEYMHKKYGVIASLQVADQYDLDVYSVWGQPWSIPYLASQESAAAPAASFSESLGVVIMQWAPRDPTDGYGNTPAHSTYSMQDYPLKKYDSTYASYLMNVFLKNPYDQVVVGLESGFPPASYTDQYKTHLLKARALQKQNKVTVETAGNFAEKFLERKQVFGGTAYFLTKAYGSEDQSFWFNGENYRAGIKKEGKNVYLVDVRDYAKHSSEEFYQLPNTQGYLRINAPAVIDSARFPQQKILIGRTNGDLRVKKENDVFIVSNESTKLAEFGKNKLTLPIISRSFVFERQEAKINIFLILLFLLFLYMMIVYVKEKDLKKTYLHFSVLFFCLYIARPFFTSDQLFAFLFDKKELFLMPLISFIPFNLSWKLIILFQIIPFVSLLILYFIFGVVKKMKMIASLCLVVFLLLVGHVPDFIVTEFITKKKIIVMAGLSTYLIIAAIVCVSLLFKKKSKRVLATSGFYLLLGFVLLSSTLLLSWQKFVLTPFEMASLQQITLLKKDVYYVMPKEEPVYRAIEPLLLKGHVYGGLMTKTDWEVAIRPEGKRLEFTDLKKKVIVVPRYLGADMYPEEIVQYKLRKIFDNSQIAIYSL